MNPNFSRRDFLKTASAATLSALAAGYPRQVLGADGAEPKIAPTADTCIILWMAGGMAHTDTFDPKRRGDGKKKPGSYYDAIPTAIAGERVSEHLGRVADRLDRCVLVRSLHHAVVDEHAAATNLLHTGSRRARRVYTSRRFATSSLYHAALCPSRLRSGITRVSRHDTQYGFGSAAGMAQLQTSYPV